MGRFRCHEGTRTRGEKDSGDRLALLRARVNPTATVSDIVVLPKSFLARTRPDIRAPLLWCHDRHPPILKLFRGGRQSNSALRKVAAHPANPLKLVSSGRFARLHTRVFQVPAFYVYRFYLKPKAKVHALLPINVNGEKKTTCTLC